MYSATGLMNLTGINSGPVDVSEWSFSISFKTLCVTKCSVNGSSSVLSVFRVSTKLNRLSAISFCNASGSVCGACKVLVKFIHVKPHRLGLGLIIR